MKKRLLSLVLVLVMVLSLVPSSAFAAATRYSLQLLYGTDYVVKVWASNEGETTYTKNKEVTLTDSAGNEFTGWAQEIVEVTDEATDEWNTKFYYDTTTQKCVLVLNGAKLDSFNNDANTIVSDSNAIYGLSTNNSYNFHVIVKADSLLESGTAILGNGSVNTKLQSLEVTSEGNAKLTCNNKGYFAHLQGSYIKLNANIDFNGNGNSFLYLNKGGAYYQIDGGHYKVTAYRFTTHSNSNYPVYVNGGSFDVTTTNRFAYSPIVFADGLCYTAKNASGTNLNLSSGNSSKRVIVNTYGDHVLAGENTDCTAGGTCSVCSKDVAGRATHEIAADDGNCTTAITCKYCDVVMAEGAADHVPGEPSGDCTVAVKCVNCDVDTTPAKEHTPKDPVIENETEVDYDSVVYCDECGKEISRETLSKLCPHTNSVLLGQEDYTCTENGIASYHCNDCEEDYEVILEAPGHDHKVTAVVGATISERGYSVYTCTVCGDTYMDDYVDKILPIVIIGTTPYFSLKEAVEAAQPGDTLIICRSQKVGEGVYIDKDLTIDFRGCYYSIDKAYNGAAMEIAPGVTVTLKNSKPEKESKLSIAYSNDKGVCATDFTYLIKNDGTLYVKDVVLNGSNTHAAGETYTLYNAGVIYLDSGAVVTARVQTLFNVGTITKAADAEVTAPSDYHFNDSGVLELHNYTITKHGATVYEVAYDLYTCSCGEFFKEYTGTNKLSIVAKNPALGMHYASLQEAIDAAESGQLIEMTQRSKTGTSIVIPAGKKLTIDMKGYYYAITQVTNGAGLIVEEGAELNLISTDAASRFMIEYTAHENSAAPIEAVIKNNGTLKVENIHINGNNLFGTGTFAVMNYNDLTLKDNSFITVFAESNTGEIMGNYTLDQSSDARLATSEQMENVDIQKTATAGGAITLHPGSNVTYTITITNNNYVPVSLNITDSIPKHSQFLNGCDDVRDKNMHWTVKNIQPDETVTITYALTNTNTLDQVKNAYADIVVKNTDVKVVGKTVAAEDPEIYVLETFNKEDRRKIEMGIDAMVTANLTAKNSSKQEMNRIPLVNMMYYVGFSAAPGFGTSDPDAVFTMIFEQAGQGGGGSSSGGAEDVVEKASNLLDKVVPTLYGGTAVPADKDVLFRGARATEVTTADLISGDVIFVNNDGATKIYIYDGTYLVELAQRCVATKIDPASVLSTLPQSDKYVVLRVSISYNITFALKEGEYFNAADKEGWTDLEKQLIATAESYLLRGDRNQYTDDMTGISQFRWQSSLNLPEDCTIDQYGYSNCAAFTYDVHWATYGVAHKAKNASGSSVAMNTTTNLASATSRGWDPETLTGDNASSIFYCTPMVKDASGKYVSTMTAEEQAATKELIISLLRPGDIICIRRTTSSGHAMLYAGNGTIIHSSGSSYSDTNKTDTHEATIRFRMVEDLFDPSIYNSTSYVFNLVSFSIVRLQNLKSDAAPTENTVNRVENMQGVVAEKVSSTAMGKTVNCGDEITYTFHIFNTNKAEKEFAIRDILDENVTFVSATNGGVADGSNISWDIVVPAETRVSVSYTVKVKDGLANYTEINNTKATINGVMHRCHNTYVANTLTTDQQQTLLAAIETVKGMDVSGLNSVELVELIYKTAFGVDDLFGEKVTNFSMLLDGGANQDKNNPVLGEDNVGIFNDTKYWSSTSSNTTNRNAVSFMDSNTSKPALMVAPGMWGGGLVYNSSYNQNGRDERALRYLDVDGKTVLRSRYYWEKDLVIGDVYVLKGSSSEWLFIYVGNNTFVTMAAGTTYDVFEEVSVSYLFEYTPHSTWKKHAVLRPSITLGI